GGGVAGTTAAETIRLSDRTGSMAIVTDEPNPFYSRIMLSKPNFFLEKIPFDRIWLKKDSWYPENKIQLISGKKAVKLQTQEKTVTLNDGTILGYKKLLLALGSRVRLWDVPGADKDGVLYLRTLEDAKKIIAKIKITKQAVAIGAGFTSFETCEMLKMAGLDVTLVIREAHYWDPIFDQLSGQMVEQAMEKGGVKIIKQQTVMEVLGGKTVEGVRLADGRQIPCQIVVAGIGVYTDTDWLKQAGLNVNRGVITDEFLRASTSDIWAAGDAAEYKDVILEEHVQMGNWVNAQTQGRMAGNNMSAASPKAFKFVSFYTTQGFGLAAAFAGDVRPLPDRQMVARGGGQNKSYGRLIVDNKGELIGATLVNRTPELATINKLIENNV
ncbi:MAG: FAD-dependent oxidoreductase, partial [Patescibacteria group bacterium]